MSKKQRKQFIRCTEHDDEEYQIWLMLNNFDCKLLSFKSGLLTKLVQFKLQNNISSLEKYAGYIEYYGISFDNKNTHLLNMNNQHMKKKFENYKNLIADINQKYHNGHELFKKIQNND